MEKTVIKIESLAGVERTSAEFAAAMDRAADAFVKAMDQATVFAFFGEMGAGKTTFISALVRHLGVEEDESTPSEIHYRAKMLLHNRDDLINFAIVPESCGNFHGKSG